MSTGHPYVKSEKFRKSCPISIYDVAAVETWLEDLARKGENPVCFTGSRVDLLLDEPWGPSGSGGAMTRMPRSWTRTRWSRERDTDT